MNSSTHTERMRMVVWWSLSKFDFRSSKCGIRNRCRCVEVRTITAAIVAALFYGGVMQTSNVRSPILTQTIGLDLTVVSSKLDVKCGCFQSTFRRRRFQGHGLGAHKL
jgi:hypothetical protein